MKWCRKAADQGIANAQCNLGAAYFCGSGVAQDYVEAAKWYRKAADQSSADAQAMLGWMYDNGQALVQGYIQAHMWMNLAAAQSHGKIKKTCAAARDSVAAKMNRMQIAEAQRLAREWKIIQTT